MKLSEFRTNLYNWVQTNLAIDSWYLAAPETVGDRAGLLPPIKDLSYWTGEDGKIYLKGTVEIWVTTVLDGNVAYRNLSIGALEGLYQSVAIKLLKAYKNIDPGILELSINTLSIPINVVELPDTQDLWEIQMCWSVEIVALAEAEVGQELPPIPFQTIKAGIYRSKLEDIQDKTLDYKLDVNKS